MDPNAEEDLQTEPEVEKEYSDREKHEHDQYTSDSTSSNSITQSVSFIAKLNR